MSYIYNNVELLTITYKSNHIIFENIKNIDEKFKITVVENSNDLNFKHNIEKRITLHKLLFQDIAVSGQNQPKEKGTSLSLLWPQFLHS